MSRDLIDGLPQPGRVAAIRSAVRFSLRMTAATLATFAVVQVIDFPLHGLWAILTAVLITQASIGGSIRSTVEYLLGTLVGAIYASLVAFLVPHDTPTMMAALLALAIAPLAYGASSSPIFRVAPFTAVIVLLVAGEFGEDPLAAAATRITEVAVGGGVAVLASLLVLPERAYARGRRIAVSALEMIAEAVPRLLAGFSTTLDLAEIQRLEDELGATVIAFDDAVAEARHEIGLSFGAKPNAGPLSRTLRRLRHDLVIIGRAAAAPFPAAIVARLDPHVDAVAASASAYVGASAAALAARRAPPPLAEVDAAIAAYSDAVTAIRNEGLTRILSADDAEQFFALGFAFDQLRRNLGDLDRCVRDWMKA